MDVAKIFFDNWDTILRTIIAAVVAYAGLVLILRVSGKRTLAKLNAFDWVVSVALGSTLATILLSADVALAEGLLALSLLVGLQWVVARTSMHWPGFKRAIRSEPRLLLKDGKILESALHAERVTEADLKEAIRNKGFGDLADVAAVVLETDGSFSVISRDKAGSRSALEGVSRN